MNCNLFYWIIFLNLTLINKNIKAPKDNFYIFEVIDIRKTVKTFISKIKVCF